MSLVELMTISETFKLEGRGIVLAPSFFPHPHGRWKNRIETVVIQFPDGSATETQARFELNHLNIPDPNVPIELRWQVVVTLPDHTEKPPVGSNILVSPEARDALIGPNGD